MFFDDNFAKFIEITNSTKKHETRITKLQYVWLTANEKLLIRVLYAGKIRDIRFNSCFDQNKTLNANKTWKKAEIRDWMTWFL